MKKLILSGLMIISFSAMTFANNSEGIKIVEQSQKIAKTVDPNECINKAAAVYSKYLKLCCSEAEAMEVAVEAYEACSAGE